MFILSASHIVCNFSSSVSETTDKLKLITEETNDSIQQMEIMQILSCCIHSVQYISTKSPVNNKYIFSQVYLHILLMHNALRTISMATSLHICCGIKSFLHICHHKYTDSLQNCNKIRQRCLQLNYFDK